MTYTTNLNKDILQSHIIKYLTAVIRLEKQLLNMTNGMCYNEGRHKWIGNAVCQRCGKNSNRSRLMTIPNNLCDAVETEKSYVVTTLLQGLH